MRTCGVARIDSLSILLFTAKSAEADSPGTGPRRRQGCDFRMIQTLKGTWAKQVILFQQKSYGRL
jgi:hypothetical protein